MLSATVSDLVLASTSMIEDSQNHDEICGLKLSYNYKGAFVAVLVSTDTPRHYTNHLNRESSDSIVLSLIERFNDACTWTERDRDLDDVSKRLENLWQETEELVKAVIVPELVSMIERGKIKDWTNHLLGHEHHTLHDYLFPPSFVLQIVPHHGTLTVIERADLLPSSLPFTVQECGMFPRDGIDLVYPKDVLVLQRFRNHVLKVQVDAEILCCKLSQAGAQGSFLRELRTLYQIHKSATRDSIRVPKLRGVVGVEGGSIWGLLTDFIDTNHPDMMAVLQRSPNVPRAMRHMWSDQIVKTIELLHSHNLVWGDSKTANVLICKQQNAWLTDFGGGITRGYIDERLYDSKEGDLQGLRNILTDIHKER